MNRKPSQKRAFTGLVGMPLDETPQSMPAPVPAHVIQIEQQKLAVLMEGVERANSVNEVKHVLSVVGRPRKYTDDAAKQRAYRERQKKKVEMAALEHLLSKDSDRKNSRKKYLEALSKAGFDANWLAQLREILGAPRGFGRPTTGGFGSRKLEQMDARGYLQDYEDRTIGSVINTVRPEGNGVDEFKNRKFTVKGLRTGDQVKMEDVLTKMGNELFQDGICLVCGFKPDIRAFHLVAEHEKLVKGFFKQNGLRFRKANLMLSIS